MEPFDHGGMDVMVEAGIDATARAIVDDRFLGGIPPESLKLLAKRFLELRRQVVAATNAMEPPNRILRAYMRLRGRGHTRMMIDGTRRYPNPTVVLASGFLGAPELMKSIPKQNIRTTEHTLDGAIGPIAVDHYAWETMLRPVNAALSPTHARDQRAWQGIQSTIAKIQATQP